jgi:transaldolase
MQIFLDSVNRDVIKKLLPTGLIDGITTNPSLLCKAGGGDFKALLADICAMVPGPVSIEVVEHEPAAVLAQALRIAAFAKNAVVKIPFAQEYLPIIKQLAADGVALNITLVFTPLQALLLAKLGVQYVSPFVGRWDDAGIDGLDLLEDIIDIKNTYEFDTQILAASIRSTVQWQHAARMGADVITVSPTIFEQVLRHPMTERGIAAFNTDWQKLENKTFL